MPGIVPHDPQWKAGFAQEAALIKTAVTGIAIHLHHIGSTAISAIMAKPIIDLLGVVDQLSVVDAKAENFAAIGYEAMGDYGIDGRRYFRKTNVLGTRTHHLHVFENRSPHIVRHLAFRDYLNAHPAIAMEYSALKEKLTTDDHKVGQAYQDGKAPFIAATERDALTWWHAQPAF